MTFLIRLSVVGLLLSSVGSPDIIAQERDRADGSEAKGAVQTNPSPSTSSDMSATLPSQLPGTVDSKRTSDSNDSAGEPNEVQDRASQEPKPEIAADLQKLDFSGVSAKNEYVELVVVKTLLPGQPDYLPKSSQWIEHLLSIKNLSVGPLTVKKVRLVDENGVFIDTAKSAHELVDPPNYTGEVVRSVAMTGAGSAITTGAALAAGTAAVVPFLLPLMALLDVAPTAIKMDEMKRYETQVSAKALKQVTIDSQADAKGSVFFPLVKRPRAMYLEVEADGQARNLRLNLPNR